MADAPIHDLEKFRERAQAFGQVICTRCKGLVDWFASKCERCGLNFNGPAFQFCHEIPASAEKPSGVIRLAVRLGVIVLLTAVAIVILWLVKP
ncbi:MAG: hypothetical protein IT462_04205 [Planctomycetes bacterium]|nr:hypothetical protein [Planctomycetota bacterium]